MLCLPCFDVAPIHSSILNNSCFGMLGSLLFGIVLFFLLAAQKGPRYVQTDIVDEVKHYDTTYYPRVLIFSIMVIALFFSALSICCTHLEVPLHVSALYIYQISHADMWTRLCIAWRGTLIVTSSRMLSRFELQFAIF